MDLSKDEIKEIFDEIDADQSGFIDFDEFLMSLRVRFNYSLNCKPPMSKCRLDVLNKAFLKMDKTKDGAITVRFLYKLFHSSFILALDEYYGFDSVNKSFVRFLSVELEYFAPNLTKL